jgi:hypothetical protein
MPDPLSAHYQDLLASSYDCVDRIVLNAYFRLGGFRNWWQPRTARRSNWITSTGCVWRGAFAVASAPMPTQFR